MRPKDGVTFKPETELLLSLAFVFTNPDNWTQRAWARDAYGYTVSRNEPYAACFCLSGGLRVAPDPEAGYRNARSVLFGLVGDLVEFNDNHTAAEVVDVCYRAAELAEYGPAQS